MTQPAITVVDDYEALSKTAAEVIAEILTRTPSAKVVAATGETPMGVYRELARCRDHGTFDPSSMTVFVLDEYVGAPDGNPRSLADWLRRAFVEPLGISDDRVIGLPEDGSPGACAAYDRALGESGGFDLAILGIGTNGHIGFNEPPSEAWAPTRLVELSQESLASNQRYREDGVPVPGRAVTVGMVPLLASRACVLLASGSSKADILRQAMRGPVGPHLPASFLQEHGNLTVIADRAAWPGQENA
jgi:glucosamine-6-phosphate deaminase